MPAPARTYQSPAGSTPASRQICLLLPVRPGVVAPGDEGRAAPGRSPANASAMEVEPRTLAGSAGGPTRTKSLCMTARRPSPWPSAMNRSSSSGEWARITSASPRRPSCRACPLPTATTFTSMPVCSRNSGTSTSSRPLSCVLVVVASVSVPCVGGRDRAARRQEGQQQEADGDGSHPRAWSSLSRSSRPARRRRCGGRRAGRRTPRSPPPRPARPSSSRPTRWATRRAWNRLWVAQTTSCPGLRLSSTTTPSTRATWAGSRWAVGSSSSSTSGSIANALARATSWACPPERLRADCVASLDQAEAVEQTVRPTGERPRMPRSRSPYSTLARTVPVRSSGRLEDHA